MHTKVEWANSKHAKVYSFIPASQLPRDSPHKYDAFLQPFIEELTDLYIDGCEVFYYYGNFQNWFAFPLLKEQLKPRDC